MGGSAEYIFIDRKTEILAYSNCSLPWLPFKNMTTAFISTENHLLK